jgi:hypothetical protein
MDHRDVNHYLADQLASGRKLTQDIRIESLQG